MDIKDIFYNRRVKKTKAKTMIDPHKKHLMKIVDKLTHKDKDDMRFTLHMLQNMRDHSERYLRHRVSHFYDKMGRHNYPDRDVNYLRYINQDHYGMVVHDYFPSRVAKKRDLGQRGMIKLIVDASVAQEFYKVLVQKKYIVIKIKIHLMMNRETNMEGDEVELEWKKKEEEGDSGEKIALKSVWCNRNESPTEDEPSLELFDHMMMKYYRLEDLRMYTPSHQFYHFTIIDNQETSADFVMRLYDLIVKQFGKFEHQTFKDECDCIYLNSYVHVYAKEHEMSANEVDVQGFFCGSSFHVSE